MVLSKEQINRYLRHILMPEISGPGQKKLLDAKVIVYGEKVSDLLPSILYLSSMGIGNIYCYFENSYGYSELFTYANDLNGDININLLNENEHVIEDFRIVIGSTLFINKNLKFLNNERFSPLIISLTNNWKCANITINNKDELNKFLESLGTELYSNCANHFVLYLVGAICTIEVVKLCLNIGEINRDLLVIDLFNIEFSYYKSHDFKEVLRLLNEGTNCCEDINENLLKSKVLIVGAGGLGSPIALALAVAGVGTIGIVDSDNVEISNLNRQILHSVSRIGMPKVESAKIFLKEINNNLNIITYATDLTSENSNAIIKDYDLVVSAVDNIQTRYLINDICYFMKKPVIEAGVLRFDGTNTTIVPDDGHCYRCLFPNLNTDGMSCAETGVLGAVPGVMGFIQASEVYKLINNVGVTLKNKVLLFDSLEMEFTVIDVEKNLDCPLCGNK